MNFFGYNNNMPHSFQIIDNTSLSWEAACHGFAAVAHNKFSPPKAIFLCASPTSLQEALQFVKKEKAPFCLRSGRHNYEGQSSNAPGGYIIDTSGIKTKTWLGGKAFRLGAGLSQIEIVRYLEKFGCTIPYATGGTVGLAGLILGGGVGLSSRTWGTVAHHAIRLHCVFADGSLRWIEAGSEEAKAIMSSGGGSIAALAEVEVRAHWRPLIPVFAVTWDAKDALSVLEVLDREGADSDDRLGFVARFGTDGAVALYGQCNSGGYGTAVQLLKKLIRNAPVPISTKVVLLPHFLASKQFFRVTKSQPDGWHAKIGSQLFKSSSAITMEPITAEIAKRLVTLLAEHPKLRGVPEEVSMVQILVGGGALWNADHAHIPHFKSRVLYQLDGYWLLESDKNAVLDWVAQMRGAVAPVSAGSYINYVDSSIPEVQRAERYFGSSTNTIAAVKKRLDPENFFTHDYSLKP